MRKQLIDLIEWYKKIKVTPDLDVKVEEG